MKKQIVLMAVIGLMTACSSPKSGEQTQTDSTTTDATEATDSTLNKLNNEEQTAGYQLLFNGKDYTGWHCYHRDTVGWKVENGIMHTKGGNGDLVSDAEYENFELAFDWKVGKAGNSGVIYMVQDDPNIKETYYTGVEYQVIDHDNWPDKLNDVQKAGAVYDLYAPTKLANKPVGEWNTGKIISNKGHIEHYLNGEKVAEYDWNSTDYKERFAKSKFKDWPFAKKLKGHIALQDHGQEVWYRNVKVKTL